MSKCVILTYSINHLFHTHIFFFLLLSSLLVRDSNSELQNLIKMKLWYICILFTMMYRWHTVIRGVNNIKCYIDHSKVEKQGTQEMIRIFIKRIIRNNKAIFKSRSNVIYFNNMLKFLDNNTICRNFVTIEMF